MFECLNPLACAVTNITTLVCALHATGPLCATCDEGYVPDADAADGRCTACASSGTARWGGKAALLGCAALVLFLIALIAFTRPAPKLKIDKLLGVINMRRLARRVRKRILRRLNERDYGARDTALRTAVSIRCDALLDRNEFDAVVALRRAAMAASAAASAAAATVSASIEGGSAGLLTTLEHAAGHVGEQILVSAEDRATALLEEYLDAPDVDGSLSVDGVRRTSVITDGALGAARAAAGLLGDAGGESLVAELREQARGGAAGCVTTVARLLERATQMVSMGQLKIVMGNLQINASLTVVFSIPWPPVHVRFINALNVFKLDIFKGLAFAAPCLHSNHFMSLASFVAAPIVLALVLGAAYGVVALASVLRRHSSRKARRALRKLPMCQFTAASAGTAAIKVGIIVILFIYPTICSKVFMTFKCTEAGGAKYMVADMTYRCYEGEWLLWAAISGVAMVVCAYMCRRSLRCCCGGGYSSIHTCTVYPCCTHTHALSLSLYFSFLALRVSLSLSLLSHPPSSHILLCQTSLASPYCYFFSSALDASGARCTTPPLSSRALPSTPEAWSERYDARMSTFAIASRTNRSTCSTKHSTGGAFLAVPSPCFRVHYARSAHAPLGLALAPAVHSSRHV
jgi:hypothetical protein